MADLTAVHLIGESVSTMLLNAMPALWRDAPWSATVSHVSTSALDDDPLVGKNAISLLLYRIGVSEFMRNARPSSHPDELPPLSLELGYMVTAWGTSAEVEHTLMAWAMHELHKTPVLDISTLDPAAGWEADEVIHLIPQELGVEDMMRVWDALKPNYRLSACYTARVLRIDRDLLQAPPPVVATRLTLGESD